MNIALVTIPPSEEEYQTDKFNRPSLGLGNIVAFCQKHRNYIDNYDIISPNDFFNKQNPREAAIRILKNSPLVIGFTMFLWNRIEILEIIEEIKKLDKSVKIIFGGPEAAFSYKELSKNPNLDWICTSEGELPFLQLIQAIDSHLSFDRHLPGLFSCRNSSNSFVCNSQLANLDSIPSPYINNIIQIEENGWVDIETMRGCPSNCNFCSYGKLSSCVRTYSIDRIEKEFKFLHESNASEVYLLDPMFNFSQKRSIEICHRISGINSNRKLNISSELKAELINSELALSLKKANFTNVEVGLQSTNPLALKLMNRKFDRNKFLNGLQLLKDNEIHTDIGIIVGLPGDTYETIMKTIDFVVEHELGALSMYKLQVLPNTIFRKYYNKFGILFSEAPPYFIKETQQLSQQDIEKIFSKTERILNSYNEDVKTKKNKESLKMSKKSKFTIKLNKKSKAA